MKKLVLIALFLGFTALAYAEEWTAYAFEDVQGTSIVYVNERAGGNIFQELKKMGKEGTPFIKIDGTKLPDRADRDYWKIQGDKIVVNQAKKDADTAKKNQKQQKIDQLKTKLGVNNAELDTLKEALK